MAQNEAETSGNASEEPALALSLVRGDAAFRLQRAIGLIPPGGLGVARRALLLALVTYLPIAVWAIAMRRAFPGVVAEPLMQHFGVHVRSLIAIPLLVVAEAVADGVTTRLIPYFVTSGMVRDDERPRFVAAVRGILRLRDASFAWMILAAIVFAWVFLAPVTTDAHQVSWAAEAGVSTLGFGGWWFLYVARPIYIALLLAWLWRLALLFLLMRRIAALDLALVPTHPDRCGGLGFLEALPSAFSLVVLAMAAVLASRWAHDVVYHDVHVVTLRMPAIAFVVVTLALFLVPLLVFLPKLTALKRRSLLDYGALVGRHGRLVGQRWIARESVPEDGLLNAPEIGPVADAIALYEAVEKVRPAPIGMRALLAIALPAALPILAVFAIEVPFGELLKKLISTIA